MNSILNAINVALFIGVAFVLVRKYWRSGQPAFLWLVVPLVLLPFLGMPLSHWVGTSMDRLGAGEVTGVFPFTLVETKRLTLGGLLFALNGVEHVVWSTFVLVAVLMFKRPRGTERKA